MKVAIIHYWLVNWRGGEKVLEELCRLFPKADIYTHVIDPLAIGNKLKEHKIQTSFIAHLPWARRFYQWYLPLMPQALENFDLSAYDLVISSESGPAKGVLTAPHTVHICYCHTPMRYVWNMYGEYRRSSNRFMRLLISPLFHYLRIWDYCAAARVDHFVANSSAVAARIEKYYRRGSTIIAPPVDVARFQEHPPVDDGFYLCCGELVGYKRVDQAIEACNRLSRKLIVVGGGEHLAQLRKIAGPTVEVLGRQPDDVVTDYYRRCSALLFPGEEDFGIVPLEAMAAGKPVIAFGRGGACDTVSDGVTGILYQRQSVEQLMNAIIQFEQTRARFVPQTIIAWAARFSAERFRERFGHFIRDVTERHA
jgi:glycosyltransferase involved in cell wall biosynthesis